MRTGYRAGDQREISSICVTIDHHIGAAELARELGDTENAGRLIRDAFELHRALRRLEAAVVRAECARAVEALVPGVWAS